MTKHPAIMLCGDVRHDDADTLAYQTFSDSLKKLLKDHDVALACLALKLRALRQDFRT